MFFYIIFRNRSVLWVTHHVEREKESLQDGEVGLPIGPAMAWQSYECRRC